MIYDIVWMLCWDAAFWFIGFQMGKVWASAPPKRHPEEPKSDTPPGGA